MATTYMALDLPSVLVTPDPTWATKLNTCLTQIDAHTHEEGAGLGKKVPTAGLNINADLSCGSYNLTALKSTRYTSQAATLSGPSDLNCTYFVSGNLYANDGSGNAIQITAGGTLNSAALASAVWKTTTIAVDTTIAPVTTAVMYEVTLSSARVVTLPLANAVTPGRIYAFKAGSGGSGTNTLTIQRQGSDTVDGATSIVVSLAYGAVFVVSDGSTKWHVFYLDRRPIDLAGGATHITGILPTANMTQATTGTSGAVQLAQDLAGTNTAPTVVALTGAASKLPIRSTAPALEWAEATVSPVLRQAPNTTTAGQSLTVAAQSATSGNNAGGHLILSSGAPFGTGAAGGVKLQSGGEDAVLAYRDLGTGGGGTLNRVVGFFIDPSTSTLSNGNKILQIANGTMPVSATTGGCALGSVSGDFATMNTNGHYTQFKVRKTGGAISLAGAMGSLPANFDALWKVNIDGADYAIPLYTGSGGGW